MPVAADIGVEFPGGEEQHHLLLIPLRFPLHDPPVAVLVGEGEGLPPGEPFRGDAKVEG
jgi:hypothetical protein